MAKFFIEHPRFAAVVSLVITIAGILAMILLPVAQYPEIAPPEITVNATFPGANAPTVRDTVGAIIEREVNGVEDMLYMKSTSANDGTYTLVVTFEVGADSDKAQTLVQNRVNKALPKLPEDVRRKGIKVEKESSTILQIVTLSADSEDTPYDDLYLANYASLNLRDTLLRVPGVGKVQILNNLDYSARVWMDPVKMSARNLTPQDIIDAIREQNVVAAAGQIGALPTREDQQFQYTIQARGRMESAEAFEKVILRSDPDGSTLYLKDVARLELGAEMYLANGKLNGRDAAVIAIYQQPGANALNVGAGVKASLQELATGFPDGISYAIPYDSTRFVEISIDEVYETLIIAVILVVLVTYAFLQDARATLIPSIAIPVSLIGSFALMMALGYTINLITLFGLILSIGIVVDAAIIVLENVERLINEDGMDAQPATEQAMKEVTAPLVASALVLLAVFIPVSLLPGLTGQIYQQFGVVLSIAVILSTVVALTLAPPLCVLLMGKTDPHRRPMLPLRMFNWVIDHSTTIYTAWSDFLSRHAVWTVLLFIAVVAGTWGMTKLVPTGFMPREDNGAFFVEVQMPDAASIKRTGRTMQAMVDDVLAEPGVDNVISVAGFSLLDNATASNAGIMVITLKDWSERTDPSLRQSEIFDRIALKLDRYSESLSLPFEPPAIPGLGLASGFEFMLQDRLARSPQVLADGLSAVLEKTESAEEIGQAFSTYRADVPQLFLDVDRLKVKNSGIPISDVFTTLQAQLGGYFVNNITLFGRNTPVTIQAESQFRDEPSDISKVYVRNDAGQMVPVSTLVTVEETLGPQTLTRFNLYNAVNITGESALGYSSGAAVAAMQSISQELPNGFGSAWTGATFQQIRAGNVAVYAMLLAVLFAYLFLVAQYESWMVPIAILLTVPTGLIGAFIHTALAGGDVNIYTQVGLVLMIGMAAKNAILIVEFAKKLHEEDGVELYEAAKTAARLRFRPLLMTAFSFILGVVPMVLSTGAGDGSRRALGQAVFGGMLSATIVGALLAPALYVILQRLRSWSKGGR